jgi:hypothetical protein
MRSAKKLRRARRFRQIQRVAALGSTPSAVVAGLDRQSMMRFITTILRKASLRCTIMDARVKPRVTPTMSPAS